MLLCDPKCVVFSSDPPEFYPTTPLSVEGYWAKTLRGGGFCVISNCFFWWYGVIRNRSPPYPSIYVSFRGSNSSLVEPVRLEVPIVLCPLSQGVRFEDLGLNVTLELSITRLGHWLVTCWPTTIPLTQQGTWFVHLSNRGGLGKITRCRMSHLDEERED